MFSDRGLRDELITRPEKSYRLRRVVCDLENSRIRTPCPALGRSPKGEKSVHHETAEIVDS